MENNKYYIWTNGDPHLESSFDGPFEDVNEAKVHLLKLCHQNAPPETHRAAICYAANNHIDLYRENGEIINGHTLKEQILRDAAESLRMGNKS